MPPADEDNFVQNTKIQLRSNEVGVDVSTVVIEVTFRCSDMSYPVVFFNLVK
jgi:hypothetical protein